MDGTWVRGRRGLGGDIRVSHFLFTFYVIFGSAALKVFAVLSCILGEINLIK